MKRIKIMLTAITVLAAVGGALALKARTYGSFAYCSTTDPNAKKCPLKAIDKEALPGVAIAYTTVATTFACTTNTPCFHQAASFID